jgi:hypothetical protein
MGTNLRPSEDAVPGVTRDELRRMIAEELRAVLGK